jgi:hypothetical protein
VSTAVVAESWDGIEKGTLCRVKGRGITRPFRFQYVRVTPAEVSLTLYGPVRLDGLPHDGVQGFIAVRPSHVSRWPTKRKGKDK